MDGGRNRPTPTSNPLVAVTQRQAERLGLKVGSTITFMAQDKRFDATVAALTLSDGQHAYSRADFVLPKKSLDGLPVVWYGGVHADPAKVGQLQRALYAAYPTVTVINVAQALETIRSVVIQIIYVVQFPRGLLDLRGSRDPGLVDRRNPLSPHPRSGGIEDARSHPQPHRVYLFHRIHRSPWV